MRNSNKETHTDPRAHRPSCTDQQILTRSRRPVQDMCVVLDTYWRRHRLHVPIYLSPVVVTPPSPPPGSHSFLSFEL